jgi:hypothetical protein
VADFELSWRPTTGKPVLLGYFASEASALERLRSIDSGPVRRGIAFEIPAGCENIGNWIWAEIDPMSGGFRVPRPSRMREDRRQQDPPT